jgi:hypothetical protein
MAGLACRKLVSYNHLEVFAKCAPTSMLQIVWRPVTGRLFVLMA